MTASELRLGRYLRAPEGHGDGGGGGGAAGLLDDDPPAAGGDGDKSGGDKGAGGDAGQSGADPADLAWATGISAEKGDGEELTNRDWLGKRGYKDFDAVVRDARNLERSLREGGKVKIPGEDAKPEEIKAFREAIGVPEKADGYEIKLPDAEGGNYKLEIDAGFLEPMREIAHQHNVPKAAFEAMAQQFVTAQLEDMKAEAGQADADAAAKVKEWGQKADQNKMDLKRGAEILGLKRQDVAELQKGGNVGRVMDLLAKVGSLAGEDFFAGEGGSQKFGVTSLEEAQSELDRISSDKDTYAKLKAKDPTTVAKYDRLISAVAHFKAQAAKR